MSKTKEETQQPSVYDELKAKGKLTLTAKSREELFAKFDELKADADGMKLSCGCVGQTADGNFVMNVTIN